MTLTFPYGKCGRPVPLLVTYYVRDRKEKLKSAFSWYKKEVVEYVNKGNLAELAQGARGEELEYLPSVMDPRIIYRGKNRRARCITGYLKAFALGLIAERTDLATMKLISEEVARWVNAIAIDTTLA
ncbi:uncharacterized protein LOC9661358 isoform X3 [Selaginella moellendorffii]|uniref:uncharacterized protein LOC9661358 isoform X3 n=1 Tax=Selaginella moellendorffii TaxID=88036 RepID=UPI000D1C4524|nr:uncharacterized protein LOC9661358 isoform X3 [Selaginella moellendorffii]|eukprot:XP_024517405.1 uncharacterized protein LOC9661358 isoform X3 [Selaginella moellendorffii]